jgi:CDGSH-type Zn-finger protein/truncated hemoglobin YjbI
MNTLERCAEEAQDLSAEMQTSDSRVDDTPIRDVRARLMLSAVRVLRAAAASNHDMPDDAAATSAGANPQSESQGDRLWNLTRAATALRAERADLAPIDEAVAALQTISCVFPESPIDVAARVRHLRALQPQIPKRIRTLRNGPYVATNVETVTDWLGRDVVVPPTVALCRCGASMAKPFCDGTHVGNGFDDRKDSKRVADQVDDYPGQQLRVLDNRGTCAHSGFCTDRLSSVFHLGQSPFVTPSGARMDEIVRAVRACPSGALSFAVDGREAREQVDVVRERAIEVSRDGPYRVTGAIPLVDETGASVTRNAGASLEHYSLCRCGHSQNKPFCSGMHWSVRFADPVVEPAQQPTLFEWAGGFPALVRLARLFYSKYVPDDPLIGPLFANMLPDHPERVAAWLGEVFGGPKRYTEQYGGYTRMVHQHLGKALTEAQRSRWVALMCRCADEAGLPQDAEWRAAFVAYLEWGSRLALENSQPGATPPPNMSMPRWWWVCDATPGSRVSALAAKADEPAATLPRADEHVTFAGHVRHFFRPVDRQSMLFAFDLWSHDDVARHAAEILRRLESGTMPCDGAWPTNRIDAFRRWVDAGTPA